MRASRACKKRSATLRRVPIDWDRIIYIYFRSQGDACPHPFIHTHTHSESAADRVRSRRLTQKMRSLLVSGVMVAAFYTISGGVLSVWNIVCIESVITRVCHRNGRNCGGIADLLSIALYTFGACLCTDYTIMQQNHSQKAVGDTHSTAAPHKKKTL